MAYKDREARRAAEHARASEKRAALAAYKVEVGCIDCGYNEDARALEFDHINPENKERTVASLMYAAWDVIWAEVAKCDVVCANHHAIRTMERLGL
jgi:hypothetical protein